MMTQAVMALGRDANPTRMDTLHRGQIESGKERNSGQIPQVRLCTGTSATFN